MPRILVPSGLTISKLLEHPVEAKDDNYRSRLQWNLEMTICISSCQGKNLA